MLTDTLLDSSPTREPVLHFRHWLMMAAAAIAAFCFAYFGLPLVLLNIAGFIAYLVFSASKTNNWKRAALPIAYMVEVMVIGVMVIIPLIYTQALPKASFSFVSMSPPAPPPPPPAAASPQVAVQRVSMKDLEKEPTVIPKAIAKFKHQPLPPSSYQGVVGSVPGIGPGGQSDEVMRSIIDMTGTPPPPPPPKPQAPKRIWQGGVVEQARLIYGPKPDYPQLARMARIQGTVRLAALIATDGTIKDLKVISGHPLLIKAALAAVQQWRYQPTLLNGQPVEVETTIDVKFALGE
ncbi:MAG: energy transducer TonB [Pseudolabrys sp.]